MREQWLIQVRDTGSGDDPPWRRRLARALKRLLRGYAIRVVRYRRLRRPPMREKELLAQVRRLAGALGWISYHTHNSRRSEPGFPDLVLARRGRIIFAELKIPPRDLTAPQLIWISALGDCTGDVSVHVWTPEDLDVIAEILR